MNPSLKRSVFIGITAVLVLLVVVISIFVVRSTVETNPAGSTQVVEGKTAEDGKIVIKDLYSGEIEIPKYDIPICQYSLDKFTEEEGIISYGSDSALGITVTKKLGVIDWQQVKSSGVDFAMIRVGFRGYGRGEIEIDDMFEENIKGATEAGLDVGVYFYSQAVTTTEAEEEAGVVLEKIKSYQVKYPVAIYWEFVTNPNKDTVPRTQNCTPSEITDIIGAFCNKVEKSSYNAAFAADKNMGYENMDLSKLTDYDLWYYEYRTAPSFHYDFKLWQYSSEGTVPGIESAESVGMTLAMKKYS